MSREHGELITISVTTGSGAGHKAKWPWRGPGQMASSERVASRSTSGPVTALRWYPVPWRPASQARAGSRARRTSSSTSPGERKRGSTCIAPAYHRAAPACARTHSCSTTWVHARNAQNPPPPTKGTRVAVGMPDTGAPPHRSQCAELPRWALALGGDTQATATSTGPGAATCAPWRPTPANTPSMTGAWLSSPPRQPVRGPRTAHRARRRVGARQT